MDVIELKPREYQKKIFEVAKENNTLVVLPTGLGKTLIALMLAVDRKIKFPLSKILILAPTRPLVEQHLKSFEENLPELWAEMVLFTGSVNAKERVKMFQTAEIVFSTPQCIANDVRKCLYNLSDVSLLVIDECHRCLKNYDYTKVVDFYKRQSFDGWRRILGLTASPGSEEKNVREICKHLDIEKIEVRTRDSEDVKDYLQEREFEKVVVPFPSEFLEIKVLLEKIYNNLVGTLKAKHLLFGPSRKVGLLKLQSRLSMRAGKRDGSAMYGMMLTAQAIKISHAIELLETQSLSGLYDYMKGLMAQASEKKSKGVQRLVKLAEFNAAFVLLTQLIGGKVEHPKIEECATIVEDSINSDKNFKVIIFTQFRDTAVVLAERLNKIDGINAVTFVGQAKKKNTGLTQKEQKKIIVKMNSGEINVLVATSIGEEGLDIAEVSAVIFYEPIPSAIRKIQRAGRTARLAPGKFIILMTKDTRDMINHYASSAREKKMYKILDDVKSGLDGKKELTLGDF